MSFWLRQWERISETEKSGIEELLQIGEQNAAVEGVVDTAAVDGRLEHAVNVLPGDLYTRLLRLLEQTLDYRWTCNFTNYYSTSADELNHCTKDWWESDRHVDQHWWTRRTWSSPVESTCDAPERVRGTRRRCTAPRATESADQVSYVRCRLCFIPGFI